MHFGTIQFKPEHEPDEYRKTMIFIMCPNDWLASERDPKPHLRQLLPLQLHRPQLHRLHRLQLQAHHR